MTEKSYDKNLIDSIYLPFTEMEIKEHFLADANQQVAYFVKSAERYHKFKNEKHMRSGIPINDSRLPCQIEKDEKFWTATALKSIIDAPTRITVLEKILIRNFGEKPSLPGLTNWLDCVTGPLKLVLEATIPSSESYISWLKVNIKDRHLIPYIFYAADRNNDRILEGATHIDAMIINIDNGFSISFEAKVLSDISTSITFDIFRNQIVRNLDVLIEQNTNLSFPLNKRRPDRSLFCLLTPKCFRDKPTSRLYGWIYQHYKDLPSAIAEDMKHRENIDWTCLSQNIGWITFEDIAALIPNSCPWLEPKR